MTDPLIRLQTATAPVHFWRCLTCGTDRDFTGAGFDRHLYTAHGVPVGTVGDYTPAITIDGAGYAARVTEWTIGGVKARQYQRVKRGASVWDDDAVDTLVAHAGFYVLDATGQRVPLREALEVMGLLSSDGGK